MGNNEIFVIPLHFQSKKIRIERKNRAGLIHFFDALLLYLQAGFALSYGWQEVLKASEGSLPVDLAGILSYQACESGELESIQDVLERLQQEEIVASHYVWFSVIFELYKSGSGLTRGVESISKYLRNEQIRDLESHCRTLPTKVNVCLMFFFLPPTFLWIFGPLLLEIARQFNS
ncbi:MAG: hypothetical protein EBR01_01020 [Proteobacteria bacterium]|nr:hypothetical protein [Pseudomonadota bacterium]NBY19106.1 hypothetical protein [bacterium]